MKQPPIKSLHLAAVLVGLAAGLTPNLHGQQFWRTDGTSSTWVTGTNWGATALPTGGSAWVSGSNARFTQNSTVTFATTTVGNVTVDAGRTVTVSQAGTLSTGGAVRTYDIGTGATLTWTGQNVSTTASQSGFIKNGDGIWNIGAQANAYNATNFGFTLNAGTIIISGNNSLGGTNSALTINGGTIQSSGTRAYANSSITLGGNFTNSGTGDATFSGTLALGAATRTMTNSLTSGSRTFSGVISGAAGSGLTFDGTGAGETRITNTSNTFTGNININGGEARFTADGSLGNAANDIIIDGGIFSNAATFSLGAGRFISVGDGAGTAINVFTGSLTSNNAISNKSGETGSWTKTGSGTLILGGASDYTGSTTISQGTIQLTTGTNRLPTTTVLSLGQVASTNLGTLDLNGFSQEVTGLASIAGTNASGSSNTVTSSTAATLTINNTADYIFSAGTAANSGNITGAISFLKKGAGKQTLGGANTYTGTTTVEAGTLEISAANSLGSTTSGVTVSGGTLNLGGFTLTKGTVEVSSGTISNGTLTGSSYALTNTGSISAALAGAATLTKTGTGTATLSGPNTYSLGTTVSAGTLLVNNTSGSGTGSSTVLVETNGTLGGSGTISGNTTIQGSHSPGNSPGLQTFGGNLTYSGGASVVNWELAGNTVAGRGTNFDGIDVAGTLNFAGATSLNLSFDNLGSTVDWTNTLWLSDQTWLLYQVTTATNNIGNFNIFTSNWKDSTGAFFDTALTGSFFTIAQSGNNVTLNYTYNVIPEPSRAILLGLGAIGLIFRRRRQ